MRFSSFAARVCAVCALVLLLGASLAWGQAGSSTIRGAVTDPQGAVVPKATVTITNLKTNFTRSQTTNLAGVFSFELIPAGDYKLEISAEGFRKKVLTPVQALVGLSVDSSLQLDVGSMAETVQVEGTSTVVQVNTSDATLGNNFVSQQITQLPLEARDIGALLTLQPGVTRQGYVTGARSDQSNITLDGVDINEAQSNQFTGTTPGSQTVLRLSSEAVEEFRVTTLNATASQGRSSAAQVNVVTKGGTNQFRGVLFEYNRSTGFTANEFFNNRAGIGRPALIRNTFGGVVGGPVVKDKLFFFYSYEGRTDSSGVSVVRTVPRPLLGQNMVSVSFRECQICPVQTRILQNEFATIYPNLAMDPATPTALNPLAIAALNDAATRYPANDTTMGDGIHTGGFRFNAPIKVDNSSNTARIDYNITSNMSVYVRGIFQYDLQGQVPWLPDTPSPDLWSHPVGGLVTHNWTFAQNWVNNFRYGYTRLAFSDQGDSSANNISFRFVFSPFGFSRTISRTTPVHNIINDTSWVKNNHTVQFGTNIRIASNGRIGFGNAFDTAITNPSFYQGGGVSVSNPIRNFIRTETGATDCAVRPGETMILPDQRCATLTNTSTVQNAATALIGRYSQYSARFTFDADGSLLASGTPTERTFKTQEYEWYAMDTWKLSRNLTLTYGLRYGLSRPVYETGGFEVKPTVPLDEFFQRRQEGAFNGTPVNDLLTLDLSGPANGRSTLYRWDRNNFQPSISVAWSPAFENSWLQALFGGQGKSVIRSGFRITNDYFGQQLAVSFDLANTLGFTSNTTVAANTFNLTTRPAPLFTAYGQDVRPLPFITVPTGGVSFPTTQPVLTGFAGRRIESSLDEGLRAPINYQWSLTFERELPREMVLQASYVGRSGRKLLATRDVMALNNLRDPVSGMDWYTAATMLEQIRQTGADFSTVAPIPWFENILPANFAQLTFNCCYDNPTNLTPTQTVYWLASFDPPQGVFAPFWGNDWTDTQDDMEFILRSGGLFSSLFFHPQYGALAAFGSVSNSNYNAFTLSLRQRLRGLLWDFNYTFSHSLDDSSGLQVDGGFGDAFILNALRQRDSYASSDFDIRHLINVNALYDLPFGRGKRFASGVNRGVDAAIGGWQLTGIFRWNTGLPLTAPFDDARWATNWNVQSNVTPTSPIKACPTKGDTATPPKFFGCDPTGIYQSFRNAFPGEPGPRNIFRLPGFVSMDAGLYKSFTMPYNENHKLQLRWEVFNVANTQRFGTIDGSRTGFGLQLDPALNNTSPPPNWSNFTGMQRPLGSNTAGRVMQVGFRFEF